MITISITDAICIVIASMALGVNISNAVCFWLVGRKIRAEIEELDRYYDNDYFSTNNCPMCKCDEALDILDKYRKEQEDNGFFDEIMDDESEDEETYEKIKEIIAKAKEQE